MALYKTLSYIFVLCIPIIIHKQKIVIILRVQNIDTQKHISITKMSIIVKNEILNEKLIQKSNNVYN